MSKLFYMAFPFMMMPFFGGPIVSVKESKSFNTKRSRFKGYMRENRKCSFNKNK